MDINSCVTETNGLNFGFATFTAHFLCDIYAAPHILIPLFLAILTSNNVLAFNWAGYWEIIEAFMLTFLGQYVGYIEVGQDERENLTQSLIEDWLIQGGIGALLLGTVFIYLLAPKKGPLLSWNDFTSGKARGTFLIYLFIFLCYAIPTFLLRSYTKSGFPVGQLIYLLLQPTLSLLAYLAEGAWFPWKWSKSRHRGLFWFTFGAFGTIIMIGDILPTWFFANAPQQWLISAIFFTILLAFAKIKLEKT